MGSNINWLGLSCSDLRPYRTPKHLVHLVLKDGQLPLGGFELFCEFIDVGVLLGDDIILEGDKFVGLRESQYHGKMNST